MGGGEDFGCGGYGGWVAPEENEEEYRVGEGIGITENTSRRPEVDENSGEPKMAEEKEKGQRRHLSGRRRWGRVGIGRGEPGTHFDARGRAEYSPRTQIDEVAGGQL